MAEIKYESARKWLDAADQLRAEGHHLLLSDDPLRRVFTFVDDDSDVHLIGLKHVKETLLELTDEEQDVLLDSESRRALVEKGSA